MKRTIRRRNECAPRFTPPSVACYRCRANSFRIMLIDWATETLLLQDKPATLAHFRRSRHHFSLIPSDFTSYSIESNNVPDDSSPSHFPFSRLFSPIAINNTAHVERVLYNENTDDIIIYTPPRLFAMQDDYLHGKILMHRHYPRPAEGPPTARKLSRRHDSQRYALCRYGLFARSSLDGRSREVYQATWALTHPLKTGRLLTYLVREHDACPPCLARLMIVSRASRPRFSPRAAGMPREQ